MFKQGTKPALAAPSKDLESIIEALLRAGYKEHDGMRIRRKNEALTFRKTYYQGKNKKDLMQNHVQIVIRPDMEVLIFAHTEPATEDLLTHGLVAFFDDVDFAAGSRMLGRDLTRVAKEAAEHKKKSKKPQARAAG